MKQKYTHEQNKHLYIRTQTQYYTTYNTASGLIILPNPLDATSVAIRMGDLPARNSVIRLKVTI